MLLVIFFLMEGRAILPTDDIAVNNSEMISSSSYLCLVASRFCPLRSSLLYILSIFLGKSLFEIVNSVLKE